MRRIALALIAASMLAGCSPGDTQMKPPTAPAVSVQDQVAAIRNDPNMPAAQKERLIAQLQGNSRLAGAKRGTP